MQPSKAETLCRHSEKTGSATCSVDRKWYFCARIPPLFRVPWIRKGEGEGESNRALAKRRLLLRSREEKNSTKRTAPTACGRPENRERPMASAEATSKTKTKYEECNSVDLSRGILTPVCMSGQERSRSGAGLYSNDPAGAGHCAAALVRGEHRLAAKCGNSLSTSGRATAGVCQRGAVCESRPAPFPYCDFRCERRGNKSQGRRRASANRPAERGKAGRKQGGVEQCETHGCGKTEGSRGRLSVGRDA